MPQSEFGASKFFAWALTVAVAVFSAAGLAAVFMPNMLPTAQPVMVVSLTAGIVSALCLANCMACHMQRAIAGERKFWGMFWLSAAATAALSLVSVIGVHLAWDQLAVVATAAGMQLIPAEIVTAGAAVLAVIKPLSQFITEGRAMVERSIYEEQRVRADERAKNRNWDDGVLRPVAAAPAAAPLVQPVPAVEMAAAPAVASNVSPFPVTAARRVANGAELSATGGVVRAISAAVLSKGLGAVVSSRPAEPVPEAVSNVAVFDGMTAAERTAMYAARFEEACTLFAAGMDVSDVVAAKGWPKQTVRDWNARWAAKAEAEQQIAA